MSTGSEQGTDRQRLETWLTEVRAAVGLRRVARVGPRGVVLSKFEEGFFAGLEAALERLPGLFEAEEAAAAFAVVATAEPHTPRAEAWRLAMEHLLRDAEREAIIDARQRAEVMAGVDSVAALLAGVTWTDAGCGTPWQPTPGERAAIAELRERLAPDGDLFTRHYGTFEGVPVTNHCPGSRYARRFFEIALRVTGASGD